MARFFHRFDGPEKGPVLVLSNSLGTALEMWDPQMPVLTERFRVLRYDTRGHGRSEVLPGPYSIAELGKDVLALTKEKAGVGRFSFCGLSMGGMIGMWLGINAADRIEKLVLCNTSAQKIGTPELWEQRITLAQTKGMTALTEAVIERWFTPEFRARDPQAVDKVRKMLLATPGAGYAACCAAIRDHDQSASISAIRAPTLVIAGSRDPATPPDHARAIASRVRGAKVVELDAAHLSNIEARDRFNASVSEFLAA
jgi:3-oxoadipate enol-lactonase